MLPGKWKGEHSDVNIPQFNFGQMAWQEECRRVIRFWIDTGIDGMLVDTVNWYTNGIGEKSEQTIRLNQDDSSVHDRQILSDDTAIFESDDFPV